MRQPLATVVALLAVTAGLVMAGDPAGSATPAVVPADRPASTGGIRWESPPLVTLRAADVGAGPVTAPPIDLSWLEEAAEGATSEGSRAEAVPNATFAVDYVGFPTAARQAFEHALQIWSGLLRSAAPIRVRATWEALGNGVLGSAGPAWMERDFSGAPIRRSWYPGALVDAISGYDVDPSGIDIDARFNSTFPSWSFSLTGSTAFDRYDFVSVVLHEIGHGLGFLGLMDYSSATGAGSWGYGSSYPMVFDRFTATGAGQPLLSFPNPSAALGAALRSGSVTFDGPNTRTANGGQPARLYAPSTWVPGSSYSHLNETTYPRGTTNALMTPALSNGEVIHTPGPIGLGILLDMGWNLGPAITHVSPAVLRPGSANYLGIEGRQFARDDALEAGDLQVHDVVYNDPTVFEANVDVPAGAPLGARDLVVRQAGGAERTRRTGGLVVRTPKGEFHSLVPTRILDTRLGTGGILGPVGPQGTILATVAGRGGVPATGVHSVVVNVTVTRTTGSSYLTVYPSDVPRPTASNLNWAAGTTVPNLVVVRLGADGKVAVFNQSGTTDVLIDVVGWYGTAASAAGGAFTPVPPVRRYDSRTTGGPFALNETRVIGVAPAQSGIRAVAVNLTVTGASQGGFLIAFAGGGARPLASNLNYVAGQTVPNHAVVPVNANGEISVFTSGGPVHVIVDLLGTYDDGVAAVWGGQLTASVPTRVLDTRLGIGGVVGPVQGGTPFSLSLAGQGFVPAGATGVVMNVTVTRPSASGYLTVYQAGTTAPLASNLNFVAGLTVPNLVSVPIGTGGAVTFRLMGPATTGEVIADVVGWYEGQ